MAEFSRSASRQKQHNGRISASPARFLRSRTKIACSFDERMPNVDAWWAAQLFVHLLLERVDRQYPIDVASHLASATRPRCPNLRRYIVENRNPRCSRAHAPAYSVRERGAVDDTNDARVATNNRFGSLANTA